MRAWLEAEGDRRTTWLALTGSDDPVGMVSMLEYRRMPSPGEPPSSWGYVGNHYVDEPARGRGIGRALMRAVIAAGEDRGYVRLVVSPSAAAVRLFASAGFAVPGAVGEHALLVRGF